MNLVCCLVKVRSFNVGEYICVYLYVCVLVLHPYCYPNEKIGHGFKLNLENPVLLKSHMEGKMARR